MRFSWNDPVASGGTVVLSRRSSAKADPTDRGRSRGLTRPLPPNRTGGFPASGFPVSGFVSEVGSLGLGLWLRRIAPVRRSRHWASGDCGIFCPVVGEYILRVKMRLVERTNDNDIHPKLNITPIPEIMAHVQIRSGDTAE